MLLKTLLVLLTALSTRAAKTDLAGCTLTVVPLLTEIVTTTVNGVVSSFGDYTYTTFQWNGQEQCQLLDCGGGRAPPKRDAPGCPGYTGTDTVTSLPFPTASLTLNAAVSGSTTSPPGISPSPASVASSTLLPTPTGASIVSSQASTDIPSITAIPNASSAAPLNPTATHNGATKAAGMLTGVIWTLATIAGAFAFS